MARVLQLLLLAAAAQRGGRAQTYLPGTSTGLSLPLSGGPIYAPALCNVSLVMEGAGGGGGAPMFAAGTFSR